MHIQKNVGAARGASRLNPLVPAFLISLLIPAVFHVAGVRLSVYRVLLLIVFVPIFLTWISGRAGRIHASDLLICAFAGWSVLAMFVNHGMSEVQGAGVQALQVLGAYLIGRTMIRNEAQFAAAAKIVIVIIAILMPVMAIESIFGARLINRLFDPFVETLFRINMEERWGLRRAQGPFDHPILAGVFCSAGLSLALLLGSRTNWISPRTALRGGVMTLAVFFSLSAGAFFSAIAQFGLIAWERVTRGVRMRWVLLMSGIAGFMLLLTLASGRSPFALAATYLSFNKQAAWMRINIFTHASDDVMNNPVFGIGYHDWTRPGWMLPSVDNFWLLTAMRYGLPALLFLLIGLVVTMVLMGRNRLMSAHGRTQRMALIFTLVGMFISAGTVHLWNATFVFMMFLLGSGIWMIDDRAGLAEKARLQRIVKERAVRNDAGRGHLMRRSPRAAASVKEWT